MRKRVLNEDLISICLRYEPCCLEETSCTTSDSFSFVCSFLRHIQRKRSTLMKSMPEHIYCTVFAFCQWAVPYSQSQLLPAAVPARTFNPSQMTGTAREAWLPHRNSRYRYLLFPHFFVLYNKHGRCGGSFFFFKPGRSRRNIHSGTSVNLIGWLPFAEEPLFLS